MKFRRSHLMVVGTTGLLLLGVLLELVRHFLQGDAAALAGALCLVLIPMLVMASYGLWLMERDVASRELSQAELDPYLLRQIYPQVRPFVHAHGRTGSKTCGTTAPFQNQRSPVAEK